MSSSSISSSNLENYERSKSWFLLGTPESKFPFPLKITSHSYGGYFDAVDQEQNRYIIVEDPIKIAESINHHFCYESGLNSVLNLTPISNEDASRIHQAVKASLVSLELFHV